MRASGNGGREHEVVFDHEGITSYDRTHMATYLALLHASGEGLTVGEMARSILGLDTKTDPDRARLAVETHLARARWLATTGRKHLLESGAIIQAGQ